MNNARIRPLGIGHSLMPWGAHLLAVHTSDFALDMTIIRYLEAGLIAGEACHWITASDSPADRVRRGVQNRFAHRPVCRYPNADRRVVP